jgi:recombination associated protein RdgC
MFFKNANFFRVNGGLTLTSDEVDALLSKRCFQPCGAVEWFRSGWISPVAHATGNYLHVVDGQWILALQTEEKILPASVISRKTSERAAEIEKQQGYKPGRKAMRELKDLITEELLPKAFTRFRTVYAWINPKTGVVVVDSSSETKAEELITVLIETLGNVPFSKLITNVNPGIAMMTCLHENEAPAGFTVDRDCELKTETDEGASSVRFSHHALDGDDVRVHITNGKMPTKLGLTWNDKVSFVMTENLALKKISFVNLAESNAETAEEAFDADISIMTGEMTGLIVDLVDWLGGEFVGESEVNSKAETEALATAL